MINAIKKTATVLMASLAAALLLACSLAFAEPVTYKIDDSHSFANWSLRHVASKTSGTFSDITGKIRLILIIWLTLV